MIVYVSSLGDEVTSNVSVEIVFMLKLHEIKDLIAETCVDIV